MLAASIWADRTFQFSYPNDFEISSNDSLWVVSTALAFKAARNERAIAFASRKSRMTAPLHRRTEKTGACLADPFANGEGAKEIDTFTIPDGAGGGSISPAVPLRLGAPFCQSNRCQLVRRLRDARASET